MSISYRKIKEYWKENNNSAAVDLAYVILVLCSNADAQDEKTRLEQKVD
jgi:uncharacterized protein with PhoU and TrkA domain